MRTASIKRWARAKSPKKARTAGASELAKALVADMETSDGRSVARDGMKSELTGAHDHEVFSRDAAVVGEAARRRQS
jgi:hypothetical protein